MAHINLLPWREELRKERQRRFTFVAGATAVLAVLVLFYAHLYVTGLVEDQNRRNQFLQEQIDILTKQIKEIEELEKTKQNLLARMRVIQQLQRSRPQIVHLFEELVTTIPEGVHLDKIVNKNNQLTLNGKAQSNARVSAYMRNIEQSEWLHNPRLEVIETKGQARDRAAAFTLHFSETQPDAEGKSEEQ